MLFINLLFTVSPFAANCVLLLCTVSCSPLTVYGDDLLYLPAGLLCKIMVQDYGGLTTWFPFWAELG